MTKYQRINPVLKMLRLSKAINSEASDVFYGENQFRFTGLFGWTWLCGFMLKIGEANAARLRIVTVHIHWSGDSAMENSDWWLPYDVASLPKPLTIQPLVPLVNWLPTCKAYRKCIEMFEKAGNLTTLNLVLPFLFKVSTLNSLELDQSKFRNGPVNIKLIHLRPFTWDDRTEMDDSQRPLNWNKSVEASRRLAGKFGDTFEEAFKSPEAYAKVQGWDYEMADLYWKGEYSIG